MKKGFSRRQLKYAQGLMDNDYRTKQQIALDAGFSPSTARVPKVIERSRGFKLASAHIAGEMNSIMMKLLFELNARDFGEESVKTLMDNLVKISGVFQTFTAMANK